MMRLLLNSAINDTITAFTLTGRSENEDWDSKNALYVDDAVDGGDYQVIDKGKIGFIFLERSHSKGRFGYSVTALIDTFTDFFNEAAKTYKAEQADPSTITYDKEDVIADSIGPTEKLGDTQVDVEKDNKDSAKAKLKAEAKAKLRAISSSIIAQLSAKGCKVPTSVVTELLDASIDETIEALELKAHHDYNFGIKGKVERYSISNSTLIDNFFNTFDAKLAKAKEEYN